MTPWKQIFGKAPLSRICRLTGWNGRRIVRAVATTAESCGNPWPRRLARAAPHSIAIAEDDPGRPDRAFTYAQLVRDVQTVSTRLKMENPTVFKPPSSSAPWPPRIAILGPPSYAFAVHLLAIWAARGIAVPLPVAGKVPELQHILRDMAQTPSTSLDAPSEAPRGQVQTSLLLVAPSLRNHDLLLKTESAPRHMLMTTFTPDPPVEGDLAVSQTAVDSVDDAQGNRVPLPPPLPSLLIYTSGTSGLPKGVLHSHASVSAMLNGLCSEWATSSRDHALSMLPLHHVHGLVNVVLGSLWVGGRVTFVDWGRVWARVAQGGVSVLMAVPTIYLRLLSQFRQAREHAASLSLGRHPLLDVHWAALQESLTRDMRLMISGSASLPGTVWRAWREEVGFELLERYGMTETGMLLTNPLSGPRLPGHVGYPFPHTRLALVDDAGAHVTRACLTDPRAAGEIVVDSPHLFRGYWNRAAETRESTLRVPAGAFDCVLGPGARISDSSNATGRPGAEQFESWFKTGDLASLTPLPGPHRQGAFPYAVRLLGRKSYDIIKHGGNKVSALEVENVVLDFESGRAIQEVAVVGVPDAHFGQVGGCVVVLKEGYQLNLPSLKAFLHEHLSKDKVPRAFLVVGTLPRNAMGKVLKAGLPALFDDRTA